MKKWLFIGVFGAGSILVTIPTDAQEGGNSTEDRVLAIEEREQMAERRKKMIQERMRQNGQTPGKGTRPGSKAGAGSEEDRIFGLLVRNPKLAERVGVTPEQQEELRAVFESFHTQMKEKSAKLKEVGKRQAEKMRSKESSLEELHALVEEAGAIHTEMAKLRVTQLHTIRNTLTDEQLTKVRRLVSEHKQHRMQRGPGNGPTDAQGRDRRERPGPPKNRDRGADRLIPDQD